MTLALLVILPTVLAESATDYSLLDELLKLDTPPVLDYGVLGEANEELLAAVVEDHKRCGFNGIQKGFYYGDRLPFATLLTVYGGFRVPHYFLGRNGKKTTRWVHFGDLHAPENIDSTVAYIRKCIGEHAVCKLGGRYVAITGDEVDLNYGKIRLTQVSKYRDAAWREYVKARYGDDSPTEDTNGDGRTHASESARPAKTWEDVPVPRFGDRFREPYVWLAFRDFLCDSFYDFFRRVEDRVNAAGVPFVFGMSGHGSIMWPSGPANMGGGNYWLQATRDRIFTQEACHVRWPWQMALAYAPLDRLSQKYRKPVFGWSWFWPLIREEDGIGGYRHEEVERAFAQIFSHEVHGLLYWVYNVGFLRNQPHMQTIAFWHHWFQKHWPFLKASHPAKPQVALLKPLTTGRFYASYRYPKQDYGWTVQALLDLQIPFTVITEEEVRRFGVGDYKVLLVVSAERVPRNVSKAIEAYLDRGGMVFTDCDSLAMDEAGRPADVLTRRFGARLTRKHKTWFLSSKLSLAEEAWCQAMREGKPATCPSKTPYGIPQKARDMANPQKISMAIPWAARQLATYHDVATAQPTKGARVLAHFGDEAVAIETPRTLWVGSRPGGDICATYPRSRFIHTGEPVAPYWQGGVRSAYQRAGYVDLYKRICEKAEVQRPATVLRDGQLARNINVFVRVHEKTAGLMLILIDTDLEITGAPDLYRVQCPLAKPGFQAWDLTENRALRWVSPGVVDVRVPEHGTRYVVMAPPSQVAEMARIQRELMALDLTPKPYPLGERGGPKEPPLPVCRDRGRTQQADLPADVIARALVSVTNPTDHVKQHEPIVLAGRDLFRALPAGTIRGVRIDGVPVQWDDLDGNGELSAKDEVAWQADLKPSSQADFAIDLLSQPAQAQATGFSVQVNEAQARVTLGARTLFALNREGGWAFKDVRTPGGRALKVPDLCGYVFDAGRVLDLGMVWQSTDLVSDGPVRKVIRCVFESEEYATTSTSRYVVYARQPEGAVRIYADVVHHVRKEIELAVKGVPPGEFEDTLSKLDMGPNIRASLDRLGRFYSYGLPYDGGSFVSLEPLPKRRPRPKDCYYDDALGRFSEAGWTGLTNNFGGWIAALYRDDGLIQISLRRVRRILSGPLLVDEHDGIQVARYTLTRAAYDPSPKNPYRTIDTRIDAGSRWRLDTLITLRKGFDEKACREERKAFASPPAVEVQRIVFPPAANAD